ncbi:MAG: glycine--tRNA ligase subunit beta [Desulfobacterales bacterium]
MERLLVEIGTEEIPAGYIPPALEYLRRTVEQRLTEARIAFGAIRVYGTPMRLAVEVEDVADRQEATTSEVMGPPAAVGLDADGKPTMAALKFAEKVGVDASELRVRETQKGRYLCAEKAEAARDTVSLMREMLPELILSMPFPKTMRWADLSIAFARPIRWLTALYGEKIIDFELGNLSSGRTTFGHRFMASHPVEIRRPEDYVETLAGVNVVVDMAERKNRIIEEIRRVAEGLGGRVLEDPELVDTVANLVELPVVISGRFDDRFLQLPDEVLITSMREHQKYFAVADASGALMPHFVVVNNTRARDMNVVARGHERVLRARLEDALFFYKNDLTVSPGQWVEKLDGVLFQAQLGSMARKTERVRRVAVQLADRMNADDPALRQKVDRAAMLCKADLLSQVVVEFPKLQGVMGRIYAAHSGEPPEVAAAIEEHYRPVYSGGPLPETMVGTLLAIADKLDTLCGCFSVGLVPTGASDPYALRRQSIGIISMLRQHGLDFPLPETIRDCLAAFADQAVEPLETVADRILGFLRDRVAHLLSEEGHAKDTIVAVTSVSVDRIPQVWHKVRALDTLRREAGFEPLAVAFKRVANIIRKARQEDPSVAITTVDPGRFESDCESNLFKAFQGVRESIEADLASGEFEQALATVATLREPVDAFFDGVMVMAEDPRLRNNRLALLAQIAHLFETIADFSKIST